MHKKEIIALPYLRLGASAKPGALVLTKALLSFYL
jgi:hypothetical protein